MNIIRYRNDPTVWSPFDRLSSLRDLLDSAFQLAGSGPDSGLGWSPALDVFEDENKITVKLEVAGVKKEDFDISLEGDLLTISGERKAESERREGESFRSERSFGRFSRSITLAAPVKADEINAVYENGVLTLTLPKTEEAKPKKIQVRLN
ncbi:MAG TPA: Hsp20/alpha crystallin family protein [Terrimicrobiaceae bacterium]|jgi:HSP20 family protein|nr:Hsp20/alpha crystallin family protein [Terrimicrobiaceae bacterium]